MRLARTLSVALTAFLSSCASAVTDESRGDKLLANAQFDDAVVAYRQAGAAKPGAPAALAHKLQDAQVAAALARAQKLHFGGDIAAAHELFVQIAEAAPDSVAAQDWLRKSERDFSRALTVEGKDHLGVREYTKAIESFEKALRFDPKNSDAQESLQRTRAILQWRAERGDDLWKTGLRAARGGSPVVAEAKIEGSLDYVPDRPQAASLAADLRLTAAELEHRLGVACEEKGQWHAALTQYRSARAMGAVIPGLDAAIDRMEREAKADRLVRMGQMALEKDRFEKAQSYLQEARDLTTDPENLASIEGRLANLAERRSAKAYRAAEDLELEGKVEKAVAAFRALDQMTPAYSDVRERIDRLEQRVLVPARAAYEEALKREEAGDLEGARLKLKEVLFLIPLYADARERLAKLEKGLGPSRVR